MPDDMFTIRCMKDLQFGLAIAMDGDKDGGHVHMWRGSTDAPDIYHKWEIRPDGTIRCAKDSHYGLAIVLDGDSDGGRVHMWKSDIDPPEIYHKWEVMPDRTIRCTKDSRYGLAIALGGDKDGGQVHMWRDGSDPPDIYHQWLIEPVTALKPKYWLPPKRQTHGSETRILYHKTSCGSMIWDSGKMLRGSDGAVGGAIYFAEDAATCDRKAESRGWVVKARVLTGKTKVVTSSDMKKYTYAELYDQGYDSIRLIGFSSGVEFVVYNMDQVEILDISNE